MIRIVTALLVGLLLSLSPAHATKIQRVVSPGGIEAWLVHEPTLPLIAMDFAFRGGSNQDPATKSGVAYMAGALLDDGAGELNADAFHKRLEELATELRFATGRDTIGGSIRMLKDNQQQSFDLLRLALTAPRFDADAVERVRAQVLAALKRDTTSPNAIATRVWWKTAFPNHPYGQPTNGTLDSIPLVSADDMRGYTKRILARDTLKVAVVGDIDAATLGPVLDHVFGGLPAKSNLTQVPTEPMQAAGRRIVVDLDVPQTVLSFGGPGISRKDPDFFAAYIANHILGGGSFSSRLYEEVREKRGLAYGVYSYLTLLDHTSLFAGGTQTRSEKAGEALDIIEKEIQRFANEGPTEDELAKAKAYLKGSYSLALDTSTKIANVLLRLQLDDLPIDYIEKRNAMIDAVTLADAKRVAKRLMGHGLLVTAVGRPKGITATN